MSKSTPTPCPPQPPDDERKFLHDISTPLTTAQLLLEATVEKLEKGPRSPGLSDSIEEDRDRLKRAMEALQKISTKLQERRNNLIAASQSSED